MGTPGLNNNGQKLFVPKELFYLQEFLRSGFQYQQDIIGIFTILKKTRNGDIKRKTRVRNSMSYSL